MVEVRNLPVATKLFGVFDGFKGCAAGFEASNPVSLPRACPCSARACLDPLSLDSVGCSRVGGDGKVEVLLGGRPVRL